MVNTALTFSMTTRGPFCDPRGFGRRQPLVGAAVAAPAPAPAPALSDDLKLFATTYVAGFAFVLMFLA